jgi:glutamate carboxypeptidase
MKKHAASPWLHRLTYFEQQKDSILSTIRELVEIESPSDDKPAGDRIAAVIARKFEALGGRVISHQAKAFGNHLQVDFAGSRHGKPVLLLGHYDTVYPRGTLANMPCRVADGRLSGPGVLDMKSGIGLMLVALQGLQSEYGELQ